MRIKRILPLILALFILFPGLIAAFSTQWSTQFDGSTGDNPSLPDWSEYFIGGGGQRHRLTGIGTLEMKADTGASYFGAYYRDNADYANTFPTDQDVRVMWRFKYNDLDWMGTQAGQVTGQYGFPQYYGVSGVDNNSVDFYHVETDGSWGTRDVNNPLWSSSSTSQCR